MKRCRRRVKLKRCRRRGSEKMQKEGQTEKMQKERANSVRGLKSVSKGLKDSPQSKISEPSRQLCQNSKS